MSGRAQSDSSDVARVLSDAYGLAVTDLVAIAGGADRAAALFQATTASGIRFAIKRTRGGSPAGLVLPAAVAAAHPGDAPRTLPTRSGDLWLDVDGARLSAMEWIAGRSALDAGMDRPAWVAYGRLLARLHALAPDGEIGRWVPRETFDPSRWVEAFDRADAALAVRAGAGAGAGTMDPRVAALADAWTARRDDLHATRARTLGLADVLAARDGELQLVPCHADPHLGNVIVGTSGRLTLIDFDDAMLAPPERDLMFVIGGGVLADAPATPEQQRWFAEGYGARAAEADDELLTYYRGLRTLEDVADPAAAVLDPASSDAERATGLGHVNAVLSPTGLLDQALGSARVL